MTKRTFRKVGCNIICYVLAFCFLIQVPGVAFSRKSFPRVKFVPNLAHAAVAPLVAPLPNVSGTVAGSISGEFSVNEMGAATYHLPLSIPPGTASVSPEISLDYSSQIGNGYAGMGWKISGFSVISRCAASPSEDGYYHDVDLSSYDKFCLDGERLLAVNGEYGANGTEYRTKNESFSKIISYGQLGSGPAYFVIQKKNGLQYFYGNTSDSAVEAQGQSTPIYWFVNKVIDRLGNYFTITYTENNALSEAMPLRIDYTGNATTGLAPYNSVRFEYEARSNVVASYVAGSTVGTGYRVKKVSMFTGSTLAWNYLLTYNQDNMTKESHLTSVTECGPAGDCLPSTVFTWGLENTDTSNFENNPIFLNNLAAPFGYYNASSNPIFVGDWNGDGKTDVGRTGNTGSNFFVLNGNSFELLTTLYDLGTAAGYQDSANSPVLVGDWNGDGKSDIGRVSDDGRMMKFYTSNGSSFVPFVTKQIPSFSTRGAPYDGKTMQTLTGDWNGDSRTDFARVYSTGILFYVSTGTDFVQYADFPLTINGRVLDLTYLKTIFVGDWNGDGLTDFSLYAGLEAAIYNYVSVGNGFVKVSSYNPSYGYSGTTAWSKVGDWNGDGKSDIAFMNEGSGIMTFCDSQGYNFGNCRYLNFFTRGLDVGHEVNVPMIVGDWNGDGCDDVAWFDYSSVIFYSIKGNSIQPLTSVSGYGGVNGYTSTINYPVLVGDWNGDGFVDFGRVTSSDVRFFRHNNSKTNLLLGVTDGFGALTQINYDNLTNNNVYTKGSGAVYPDVDVQNTAQVVSSISMTNGIGGQSVSTYKYEGLKSSPNAKGILGFKSVTVKDEQTGITTKTTYSQDDSYRGLPSVVEQRLANGNLISKKQNTWTIKNYTNKTVIPQLTSTVEEQYELTTALVTKTTVDLTYDDYGNVLSRKVTKNTGETETSTNTYNNDTSNWIIGQLTKIQVTKLSTSTNIPITRTSTFSYSPTTYLLLTETIEPGNIYYEMKKTHTYDAYGNMTKTVKSGKTLSISSEESTYDSRGQFPIKLVNALGHVENRTYDQRHGLISSVTGPNLLTTTLYYDSFGRKVREVNPDGTESRKVFYLPQAGAPSNASYFVRVDSSGLPPSISYFDEHGRNIRDENIGFDGRKIYVDRVYDEREQLTHVSDPYFEGDPVNWTVNEYDILGRTTKAIAPGNRVTTNAYNGLTTTITNPMGQKRIETIDSFGNIVSAIDNLNYKTTYKYDSYGQLIEVKDPQGNLTKIVYDLLGQKYSITDPGTGTTINTYNGIGQLTAEKDANGKIVYSSYDALGRLKVKTFAEGKYTWGYDSPYKGIGRLYYTTYTIGADTYSAIYAYDSLGRISSTTEKVAGINYKVSTTYDAYGRPSVLTYPSNFAVKNTYNTYGYLSQINAVSNNELFWKADKVDASQRRTQQTFGNGVVTAKVFDATTGFLKSITSGVSGAVQNLTYNYNSIGSLIERKDVKRNLTETFSYDSLNRLTQSQVVGKTPLTMTYDSIGNITSRSDVGQYIYKENGAGPHAVTTITGLKPNKYTYDKIGNRTLSNDGTIVYDGLGNVTQITNGSSQEKFTYTPEGDVSQELSTVGGVAQKSKVRVGGGIYEVENIAGSTKQLHYIKNNDEIVALKAVKDGTVSSTYYLHKDHLGSIQSITDSTGAVIETSSYDSWGNGRDPLTWQSGNKTISKIDKGYTGHLQLDSVNLVHMKGRVYDPVIGRFVSADPFVKSHQDTQSLNRYSYVENNPLSYTDPSGYFLKGLFRGVGNFLRKALPIAIVVAAAYFTNLGLTNLLGDSILAIGANGVGVGISTSIAGSVVNGGSVSRGFKAGIKGAPLSAFSAITANLVGDLGELKDFNKAFGKYSDVAKAVAHGLTSGGIGTFSGQSFGQGFLAGAAGSFGGSLGGDYKLLKSALLGGTASALGGGRFEDGAMSGTFIHLYNCSMHGDCTMLDIADRAAGIKPESDSYPNRYEKTQELSPMMRTYQNNLDRISFFTGVVASGVCLATAGLGCLVAGTISLGFAYGSAVIDPHPVKKGLEATVEFFAFKGAGKVVDPLLARAPLQIRIYKDIPETMYGTAKQGIAEYEYDEYKRKNNIK